LVTQASDPSTAVAVATTAQASSSEKKFIVVSRNSREVRVSNMLEGSDSRLRELWLKSRYTSFVKLLNAPDWTYDISLPCSLSFFRCSNREENDLETVEILFALKSKYWRFCIR